MSCFTYPDRRCSSFRLASWLGPRNSSRDCSFQPSCFWYYEVFWRQLPVSTSGKPLRKSVCEGTWSCISVKSELYRDEWVFSPTTSFLLLSKCPWISQDEEVKAVQIMAQALQDNPQSYTLLHTQCDFLISKGKFDWALKLARQAVNCAPSKFVTWEKLMEVSVELGSYENVSMISSTCPERCPSSSFGWWGIIDA